MVKGQRSFGTSRVGGPHASRCGLLQAGLAIGTLALGPAGSAGSVRRRARAGERIGYNTVTMARSVSGVAARVLVIGADTD